jgi:hypothetical protein
MAIFHGNAIPSAAEDYDIDNSCRFDRASSPKLTRSAWTSSAANRRKWTYSVWFKLGGNFGTARDFFFCGTHDECMLSNAPADTIDWFTENTTGRYITTQLFRDTNAWYHAVFRMDTTDGTPADRMQLFINGTRILDADFATSADPTLNHQTLLGDGSSDFVIGSSTSSNYWDGYFAEIHFVDGSALNADSFGETNDYGGWSAIEYSGSYGTNGFYLDFSNSATKHIITAAGNVQHSTSAYKWGSSSIAFDGTGDYLTVPYASGDFDFGLDLWTVEFWYKSTDSLLNSLVCLGDWDCANGPVIIFQSSDGDLAVSYNLSSGVISNESSGSTAIDTGAWVHIAVARTTSTTLKAFINGTEDAGQAETVGATATMTNLTDFLSIGRMADRTAYDLTGNIDSVRVSKGARYTANFTVPDADFTNDANTLLLIKSDTTNGSTTFTDSSGVTGALGNDSAGSNHFTPTNIAASDQMTDTPTNNFCTLNPLYFGNSHLSEGNLLFSATTNNRGNMATWDIPIGDKYYFEGVLVDIPAGGNEAGIGVNIKTTDLTASRGGKATAYCYFAQRGTPDSDIDDFKWIAYTGTDLGSQASIGDIVGIAVNRVDHELTMYRNNSSLATITIPSTDDLIPWIGTGGSTTLNRWAVNFGADGTFAGNKTAQGNADENGYGNFYYEPPSGFLALCTKNLPDPTVTPKEHFGIMLYDDGAGAKTFASHGIPAGVGFQPDLVWFKSRGSSYDHELTDAVRGVTKAMSANKPDAEDTDSDGLTAFGSDGFTVGTGNNYDDQTGTGMVAWCWKAGNATLGTGDFTQGTIASTCSRNVDAGFSIVSWTGTGSNGTIGHGLSVTPNLVIAKRRDVSNTWLVGSVQSTVSMDFTDNLVMNTSDALDTGAGSRWNDTNPTSSVFYVGTNTEVNASSSTYVAYCFHNVEGYSKVGSYAGNGNADGPFVYCGFRPAYLWIKRVNSAGQWRVQDDARDIYNPTQETVMFDTTTAAADENPDDFLSNGFKVRTSAGETNNSSGLYIYTAFSRTPFKYSNGR